MGLRSSVDSDWGWGLYSPTPSHPEVVMKLEFGLKSSDGMFRILFFEFHFELPAYFKSLFLKAREERELLDSPAQPQEMGFPNGQL